MIAVRVKREALDYLAALWLASDSTKRQLIAAAFDRIKKRLESDPHDEGESRENDRRILFEPPLGAYFKVQPEQSEVWVLRIWEC